MNKNLFTVPVLSLGLLISSSAHAGTATGTLNVSAVVDVQCSVSTTPVNFGSYSETWVVQASGSITVACTAGAPYLIAVDAGQNYGGWDDSRQMSNGTDTIGYVLNRNPGYYGWPEWGDGLTYAYEQPVPGTGDGTDQVYIVYGLMWPMPKSWPTSDGLYIDMVGVTIHY